MAGYDDSFYVNRHTITLPSARAIVPLVKTACGSIKSVCDLGCGVGTWLSVFAEDPGVRVLGVEGHWLNTDYCVLSQEQLLLTDLSQPIASIGNFDLAMSLEVAEHIAPECADVFIDNLVALSSKILFSAATPGQGGVNHVNEQPHEYWMDKFRDRGYGVYDCIRSHIPNGIPVFPWYKKNIYMFFKSSNYNSGAV